MCVNLCVRVCVWCVCTCVVGDLKNCRALIIIELYIYASNACLCEPSYFTFSFQIQISINNSELLQWGTPDHSILRCHFSANICGRTAVGVFSKRFPCGPASHVVARQQKGPD